MRKIIQRDRSVIPACDVSTLDELRELVKQTADIEKIGGYKIGFMLESLFSLPKVVEVIKTLTDKPVIYDHQKGGTDIPDMGKKFGRISRLSGVDAVILFPQSGPITEYEWIKAIQERDLAIIVGGHMTHSRYLEADLSNNKKNYSKIFKELGIEHKIGGFIRTLAPGDIYEIAARMGVTDFAVPGNKPHMIIHYKNVIENSGISEPIFYSVGLVAQDGKISEAAEAAGERFHAIIGRGIYEAEDKRKAAEELISQL